MSRKKRAVRRHRENNQQQTEQAPQKNKTIFNDLRKWIVPKGVLFTSDRFHGNIKWDPDELATQALIWSWHETKYVTDAFTQTAEVCEELGMKTVAKNYTTFMNALHTYKDCLGLRLCEQFQKLAEEIAGRFWREGDWALIGFDGSRATTPRSVANENAFCAPNYGKGKTAKYRKKKSKGMRRKRNEKNQQPQAPQAWITMMWHMGLRLPWTWRLGPSNSSERGHVMEMLEQEEFPEKTLFCGDAGFVGYPLWSSIRSAGRDFLVRVGANVKLLSEKADIKRCGGGIVLCWPKGKMNSGAPPLRLRLVQVKIGKTKMWMLTSVLDAKKLSKKQIVRYYKMRWGVEVEFRGLKQTVDKRKLRCRNSDRVLVELDWSIRAMAFAELIALREQIAKEHSQSRDEESAYDTKDRSLANTMRALRKCMRNLHKYPRASDELLYELSWALIQKYENRTDKKARYRPKNPDKKPLGDPTIRKMNTEEREKFRLFTQNTAA
jgi:hypothetical protein